MTTATAKHSPAPFTTEVHTDREDGTDIIDADGVCVATVRDIDFPEREEANAALFRHAPDLLAIVERYIESDRGVGDSLTREAKALVGRITA